MHYLRKPYTHTYTGKVYHYPLRHDELYEMLGLPHKLPPMFHMEPRAVTGVSVYVTKRPMGRRNSSKHRVMTICPACCKHVSFGRFHQHFKVHLR